MFDWKSLFTPALSNGEKGGGLFGAVAPIFFILGVIVATWYFIWVHINTKEIRERYKEIEKEALDKKNKLDLELYNKAMKEYDMEQEINGKK